MSTSNPCDIAESRARIGSFLDPMTRRRHGIDSLLERKHRNDRAVEDRFDVRGAVRIDKVFADGRRELAVEDPNLIVTIGRRVMSRILGGGASSPTILNGVQGAIRIIRTTTGSPDRAYCTMEEVDGTNEYRFSLTSVTGGTPTVEYDSDPFAGGSKTLTQLVAEINAVSNWEAEVMNGLGSVDAITLLPVRESDALGDQASYTQVLGDPYARTLYATSSVTDSVVVADLYVDRIRFGTEGHDESTPTVGEDVLASSEQLGVKLRAGDYGEADEDTDYVLATASYPNTGQVAFTASLGSTVANGLDISEVGLFTSGYMLARKNFGQILKASDFSLEITWTLIM